MKLIIAFAFCLLALTAQADSISGRVVAITDGDTLTLLDADHVQHKIRLTGIDAPEKANKKVPLDVGGQPFAELSKQHLAMLTFNKQVIVEWSKLDRYGRTVGKVMVDGADANLEQLKAGMAWWYVKYRKEQSPDDQRLYEQAELKAQLQRTGLWSDKQAMPPWDWRKRNRVKLTSTP